MSRLSFAQSPFRDEVLPVAEFDRSESGNVLIRTTAGEHELWAVLNEGQIAQLVTWLTPPLTEGVNSVSLDRLTITTDAVGSDATNVTLDGVEISRAIRGITIKIRPGSVSALLDIATEHLTVNDAET